MWWPSAATDEDEARAIREHVYMRPRILILLLLLTYTAALVGGAFWIWSLEQMPSLARLLFIGLAVLGYSWSLSEDMTLEQVLPRRGTRSSGANRP